MTLKRWAKVSTEGFCFHRQGPPLYVTITRRIVSADATTPDRVFQRRGFAGDVGPLVEVKAS
jgi:hypothetical protein